LIELRAGSSLKKRNWLVPMEGNFPGTGLLFVIVDRM
jgi:hypothetical protein